MRKRKLNSHRFMILIGCIVILSGVLLAAVLTIHKKSEENSVVTATAETAYTNSFTSKYVVCLDAGHGGDDVGAEYESRYEKEDTLDLTLLIGNYLNQYNDIIVVYTRQNEYSNPSVSERAQFANSYNADVLVSLHRNYYEDYEDVQGIEAWIHSDDNEEDHLLADMLLENMVSAVSQTVNRGVNLGTIDGEGEYAVNNQSNMPSCLLEVGFMTSDIDNYLYDTYLEDYAQAIADGIYEFCHTQSNT